MLDKEMIHVLGRIETEAVRFHRATQNGTKFKTYELFLEFSI